MAIYNKFTDQQSYSAIKIQPEDYHVLLQVTPLQDWIPATRVGGGHQTLIALSLRLAILHILGHRDLLILDEPTYGVDEENTTQLNLGKVPLCQWR